MRLPALVSHALLGLAAACLPGMSGLSAAEVGGYPSQSIRLVVPWPPGGPVDIVGRAIGKQLAEILGQPVVVDNRAGASGMIGTDLVAKSKPDGYTLLVVSPGPNAIAPSLVEKMPYDAARDFTPISVVATVPNVLVVNPRVEARSVADLIKLARANPGKLTYGSTGNGATPHLAAELFKAMAKVDMLHVPYKGAAPAVTDLLGGQIDMMFAPIATALPHIQSGKLRALGVTTTRRSSVLPDVPTIDESGLAGYDQTVWNGLAGPANLPPEVTAKLNAAVRKAVASPDLREAFASIGSDALSNSPEEFAGMIRAEIDKWARLASEVGIKGN